MVAASPLKHSFVLPYTTDGNLLVYIRINYFAKQLDDAKARLATGGWTENEINDSKCKFVLSRRGFTPRSVLADLSEGANSGVNTLIYVKNHDFWLKWLSNNRIRGYTGEHAATCAALYLESATPNS